MRRILPELLDELPHDCAEARRSRADLRRINRIMGNFAWVKSQLLRLGASSSSLRVAELGAGDGALALYLRRRRPGLAYTGVDLAPPPPDWPAEFDWRQGDVFSEFPRLQPDVVVVNHFLHHFQAELLEELRRLIHASPARHVLSNEPLRLPYTRLLSQATHLLCINRVTRYDMRVSIDAGFRGDDLASDLFAACAGDWTADSRHSVLGAHRMVARRH